MALQSSDIFVTQWPHRPQAYILNVALIGSSHFRGPNLPSFKWDLQLNSLPVQIQDVNVMAFGPKNSAYVVVLEKDTQYTNPGWSLRNQTSSITLASTRTVPSVVLYRLLIPFYYHLLSQRQSIFSTTKPHLIHDLVPSLCCHIVFYLAAEGWWGWCVIYYYNL